MMNSLIKVLAGAPPARIALFAPFVFILHAAEEAPTFVSWFNRLVQPGISQRLFLQVNASVLVITIVLSVFAALANEKKVVLLFLGWLSFFMFANAIFHVVATLVHARYSPGTITAVALYLPYFFWFLSRLRGDLAPSLAAIVAAIAVGSGPMILHGYLIVFKGARFF
jgi:hypothetical protein